MQSCLEAIPDDCKRLFVAYSGGLDSSVLLHLLLQQKPKCPLIPWHVNHGLVENAAQMEQFCIDQARVHGLELRVDRLDLSEINGNIEAEARQRRYSLFERGTRAGDCILTAHHADDQAETFLLNALRGAGVAGLRGIARRRWLGKTLLLRPLLDYSRAELETWAARHEIAWFDDPSNQDLRFDRNYLRGKVVPLLKQRWPAWREALSSCSEIQAETRDLLDEVARGDYAAVAIAEKQGEDRLDLARLRGLSVPRQKNLIRHWIETAGLAALPQARLRQLLSQLSARIDAMPEIRMPDYSVRIYDSQLFLVRPGAGSIESAVFDFGREPRIEIESLGLSLSRREIFERLEIEDRAQSLALRFRRRGDPNPDGHRLKRLFQRHRVPPWKRETTPQVYLDGDLQDLLP